jgi:hypothetical protein
MVLPRSPSARKVRQHLSADALYALLRTGFGGIPEHRQGTSSIPLNDCERNAARRWLEKIRREPPRLRPIVVEEGLSSNGPPVRDLIDDRAKGVPLPRWDTS